MCRTGGRRCPSSQGGDKLKLANAKRRWKYASERAEAAEAAINTKITTDQYETFKTERDRYRRSARRARAEVGRMIYEQDAGIPTPRERNNIPAPDELGFSMDNNFDYDLDASVVSNERGKRFRGSLSYEEEKTIRYYVGSGFIGLNRGLRDRTLLEDEVNNAPSIENACASIAVLDKMIEQRSKDNEVKSVYRGIEYNQELVAELLRAETGSAVQFAAYTSTSTTKETAREFAQAHKANIENVGLKVGDNYQVIIEMRSRKGMEIAGIEQEVLMPRNTTWRVAGQRLALTKDSSPQVNTYVIQLVDEDYLDELEKGTANVPQSTRVEEKSDV